MGARSEAAGQAEVPVHRWPPGAPLCLSLAAVLRILRPPLPSNCRVTEEEALATGTQRAPAGESVAHPGPPNGGKAAGTTDRQPAKGADDGDCDGGAQGRSRW